MYASTRQSSAYPRTGRSAGRSAFTLVELLTVVFIISLLIGILLPSINSARTAAKKATSRQTIKTIEVALEMFKNDVGNEFPATNGYPCSFSHPPIKDKGKEYVFEAHLGEFPFVPKNEATGPNPTVYGAHWLPALLMGVDSLGYVKRSSVPAQIRAFPAMWYTPDPLKTGRPLDRQPLYLDPSGTRTLKTVDLPGKAPAPESFFPKWDDSQKLPVIVDAFEQPILYYAANTYGSTTNMLEDNHIESGEFSGGPQKEGQPFYFHQDNAGFTGTLIGATLKQGWNFSGVVLKGDEPVHPIAETGAELPTVDDVIRHPTTFAHYILDRKIARDAADQDVGNRQSALRPVNSKTFLLISAGPDGRYGTKDDVSNLPAVTEP